MSCKYKKFDEPRFCQITNGECQFTQNGYDDQCPILHAYKDFDAYYVQQEFNSKGVVELNNIKSIDGNNSSKELNIQQDV